MTTKAELQTALRDLLQHVDNNTCLHEETYRGGTIWEICRQCDMKWADDKNPRQPHVDVPAVAAARRLVP